MRILLLLLLPLFNSYAQSGERRFICWSGYESTDFRRVQVSILASENSPLSITTNFYDSKPIIKNKILTSHNFTSYFSPSNNAFYWKGTFEVDPYEGARGKFKWSIAFPKTFLTENLPFDSFDFDRKSLIFMTGIGEASSSGTDYSETFFSCIQI